MRPVTLTIAPENAEQKVADGWAYARQRDFTGGETLAKLPEMVGRNQLIKMENAIISPEGLITECWQMDKALFVNVSGGIVVAPIPGSKLFTVYGASGDNIVAFTFDPSSPVAYDMADASGYPGYIERPHDNPVTIIGMSHGTPFLGKNYCCASTSLYIVGGGEGVLTADPAALDFGTVQTLTNNQQTVTITNETAEVMTLTGITFSGADAALFGHTAAFPQAIEPAGTYAFDVTYNPGETGSHEASLDLSNTLGILQIPLSGIADKMLTLTPSGFDFGTFQLNAVKEQTFSLENTGPRDIEITNIIAGGDNPAAFATDLALPAIIPAGTSIDAKVSFSPTEAKAYSASFDIAADVGDILGVPLTGIGRILLAPSPASAVLHGYTFVPSLAQFGFHNTSTEDSVTIKGISISGGPWFLSGSFGAALPLIVAPGETATLTVTFVAQNFNYSYNATVTVSTSWGDFRISVNGRRI